jgi:hypothetical protein
MSAAQPHATARRGYSIRVFLPDGDPQGIKFVEKFNWSGTGIVIPRSLFAQAKKEYPELNRTGIYILVGPVDNAALPQVYIGEGDPVLARLEQHANNKDFWTHLIVFTSSDQNQNLNKAHVQYLEARLVALAQAAKRCILDNRNTPTPATLSKADTADTENYLADLLLCLPVLGYTFFESAAAPDATVPTRARLYLKAKGIRAEGHESPAGFVVRSGAQAVKEETASIHDFLSNLRAELIRQGVLRDAGKHYLLTQDYTFFSPSNAAGVLLGRASNGRVEWQTAEGRTLKSIQDAEVSS